MEIQVNFEYDDKVLTKLPIEDIARFVLEWEEAPKNAEVSISFVHNQTIIELNKRYRHIDASTDVLSFECDGAEEDENMIQEEPNLFMLGDVVIAPDVAKHQMEEYGTSFEEEINLLLVHGLLHLCGYDHIDDGEAELMEAREADILDSWATR